MAVYIKSVLKRVAIPIYKNSLWNKYNNKNDDSWISKGNIVNSQINIIHLSK
ncbi:hypothetical protein [Spiroplasma endosymbiont of Agriotes lineatus]|uniref:hypothetical protein n=1 Tax=Spiroplasma endosymbiont of Agriotes lineatus TaxID=3077930 RepID=UPI0030CB767C